MKKRDKRKEKKEIMSALAMITQIGLAMMTCMGLSFIIGIYIDGFFGTKFWVMIMLLIGVMASIRSLFILTGRIHPPESGREGDDTFSVKEEPDERGQKDTH